MHEFDEMKKYIGFDDRDAQRLHRFLTVAKPHIPAIIDHFYDRILATPTASSVLQDEAQVERLKHTLRIWLDELLAGPHDLDYYERRRRIGHKHVDVALPSRFMFTAMSVIYQDLCEVVWAEVPAEERLALGASLRKVTDLDLAVMTGTFIEGREIRQLATLQELIVSNMPVAVLLVDDSGVITAATRPANRLFGAREVIGRPWQDAVPPGLLAAAKLDKQVAHAIATHREIALLRVDAEIGGRQRSTRITIVPLDHPQARILIHLEDLSEAVETEARLQRAEALARLGSLSAAVAHELRNPLAGMSGALQVLVRSFDDSDSRKAILQKVDDQIGRLNGLVTDLLTFARPTEPQMAVVDIADLVGGVVDLVQTDQPALHIQVTGRGQAWADPRLVHQILLNLVQNASHAVEGSDAIHIAIGPGTVRIEDAGPGVPADIRDEIFQPFYTTRVRGTGLGLAICDKAARSMHARLSLDTSQTLTGACFLLQLSLPDQA